MSELTGHTKSESQRRVAVAVETLDSLVGHHTAHLDPKEQIAAMLWLARRCTSAAEEIVEEALSDETVTGETDGR